MANQLRLDAIIMGGGKGERLYPLTYKRAKPAVPIGGKYRLIDIPISNCINSNIKRISILTQVNTASLHRHIFQTYKFDMFTEGNIEILAAQQTLEDESWFQGTADAVRSYWQQFEETSASHYLILAGDHLYSMDYSEFFRTHLESNAEITIAALSVPAAHASRFGIVHTDDQGCIQEFVEKPSKEEQINELLIPGEKKKQVLASMGIYIFRKDVLKQALQFKGNDFGKNIIPGCLGKFRTTAYRFNGYWEDIGTIGSFFKSNIAMTDKNPEFSFFDVINPIFTRARFLPGSRITKADISRSIINEGCIVDQAIIKKSILGIRSVINKGVELDKVYMMGADYYGNNDGSTNPILLGIGSGSVLKKVILDKNVRIGKEVKLVNTGNQERFQNELCCIRDGIIVIPANTTIPDGTVI